ncbi:MAG: translocation/assembly module TamB [Rikenellaceae bacterium]|nr:translocation/assembly module TamB [Rikenellaceae bacterium]
MRKVIKISVHILSAIILVLIVLPVIIGLVIQLPSVQNFAVRKASEWASSKLEARVSIERIDLKFFSRAHIKGFYVEDYGRDTLLYVGVIDAEVLHTGLLGGRFTLGKTRVADIRFLMHEDPDSTTNFRKIIEKIKRRNPPDVRRPFEINITELIIENLYYRLVKLDPPERGAAVNFSDLEVQRFDMKAAGVRILGDSIRMDIKNMAFREKTGLEVPLFAAKIENISGSFIKASELTLKSGRSDLNLAWLQFVAGGWESYKDFVKDIAIEGKIDPSAIDMATVAAFVPGMAGVDYLFTHVEGNVAGKVGNMSGRISNITLEGSSASFDYRMRGLPDVERAHFDIDRLVVRTSSDGIGRALAGLDRYPLQPRLEQFVDGLGVISLDGAFHGTYKDFEADGRLEAQDARLRFDLALSSDPGEGLAYTGNVAAFGVNAGLLAGVPKLGRVGFRAVVNGRAGIGGLTLDTDANIVLAEYNGYRYRDVAVKGELDNRMFNGHITSADRNIDFDFDGIFDLNDTIPRYDFTLELRNADLAALNFVKKDSVSLLSAGVRAVGSGTNPDNLYGSITVTDLLYIHDGDSLRTGRMEITGRNTDDSKYLAFNSYFADAEYRSRTSYAQLIPEIKRTLQSYIPTLVNDGAVEARSPASVARADNYSLLSIDIKRANKAVGVFFPGLVLAEGSRLSFMFNPNAGQLSLNAASEYVEYNNNFVSKLEMNTRNQGDSLSVFIRADEMYAGGIFMPDFSVIGGMKDNRINASVRFMDSVRRMTALVGVASRFSRDEQTGMTRADINFTPSSITIGDRLWNIYSRGIAIDSTRIAIRNFRMVGSGQSLTVDGTLSRSRTDTLHIDLNNFDLEPLTGFTSRLGYIVGGRTNGHADLMAARGEAILHARVEFDSIRLNDKPLPDGLFESTWDFQNERARFALSAKQSGDTVILGYFRPSTGQYLGKVDMAGIDISLVEPFFQGVLRETSGSVDVDAEITGQRRNLKVNGQASVKSMQTTVDYLNVPYQVRDAVVTVTDNVIRAENMPVYDPLGNSAAMDLSVDLNNTANVSYHLNIRPQNLLAMNTDSHYNEMFYGRVFASGTVVVRGDRRGVNLDITAVTQGDSEFYMPLGDYSGTLADIITFREPAKEGREELTEYQRRMRTIMERRRRRERGEGGGISELTMNLDVQPNLLFSLIMDPRTGDVIRGRGNGNLYFHFVPANDQFRMNGVYEISEGSYQFSLQGIISRIFTLEEGSRITWLDNPRDADLDISAVYTVKASLAPLLNNYVDANKSFTTVPVETRIMLNGNLTDPEITFGVDVPNVDPETRSYIVNELSTQESISTQFIALLALNSFYSSDSGNIGSAGGSATAVDFISSQLSNLISSDNIHIGFRYSQRSELTSDEFMVDVSANLLGRRLVLDLEGNYNAQNTPRFTENDASNLTGDFYLTWLIDNAGNLRLRGFSRRIDRFDENQGLQESGVGIYYKEDFNTVGDIVRNFRERFSRKDKRKKKGEQQGESSAKND